MPRTADLAIRGYRGEAVANEFVRQETESGHLAVMLPGFGYSCDMPLFYYAEHVCLSGGADVLRVEYAYNRRPEFRRLEEHERLRWLLDDAGAAIRAGLAQRDYRTVTLIGKSLGTLALGHLLPTLTLPESVRIVWLTPLLQDEAVRRQIEERGAASFVAIGTADPYFDAGIVNGLRDRGATVIVVDGGDHSLAIPGDPIASVRVLEQVVTSLQQAMRGDLNSAPS